MTDLIIRYASTDADVVAIHQFLVIVAGPSLPGPIDARDSSTEVWRVATHDVALMAMRGDRLVGTIGLIRPAFWWNSKIGFLTNRWLFTLPNSHSLMPLMREAVGIAKASELELHVFDETKGRLVIFNRSKKRQAARANNPKSC